MPTIQRPTDAAADLFWRPGDPSFPINSQLVVADSECVVVVLDGRNLGVIPPGTHWLHPQPFPFLGPAIVGTDIRSELWFVRMGEYQGIQFGGPLGEVLDPVTSVSVSPRIMGQFSIKVVDPVRLVVASLGQGTDTTGLLAWVKGRLMGKLKEAFGTMVMSDGVGVTDHKIPQRLAETVPATMGELEGMGLTCGSLREINLNFSPEDVDALRAATAAAAKAKLAASRGMVRCARCGTGHDGGRFCTSCGGSLPAA